MLMLSLLCMIPLTTLLLLLLPKLSQVGVRIQQAGSRRDYTGPLEVWAVERDGSRNPRSFSDLSVHQAAFSPDEKEIVVVQLDIYQALGPILVSRFTSKTIGNMRVQSPGCLMFVSPSEIVIRGNSKTLRNSLSLSLSRSCVFWTSVGCIARSCFTS